MGIRPEDVLTNFDAADVDYPEGSFKNTSNPTATDGSELIKEWVNDIFGFFQKLIDIAGITPSGVADTVPESDYFKSLSNLIALGAFAVDTGAADAYLVTIPLTTVNSSTVLTILKGSLLIFEAVNANTGPSTVNVNTLGVENIKHLDGSALIAGDIKAGDMVVCIFDGTDYLLLFSDGQRKGEVIQEIITEDGIVATGSNPMFLDNSIPAITEGDEFMTVTITPTNANNLLIIDGMFLGASSGSQAFLIAALFQDAVSPAKKSFVGPKDAGADGSVQIPVFHRQVAGGVAAITIRLRAGNIAGTTTFNGRAAGQLMGGSMGSFLRVREVKV